MINETVRGNLITMGLRGDFDVIVHGCNCFNTMGAGIALEIKNRIPVAWSADQYTKRGDRCKLGTYTKAKQGKLVVINMYTQYSYDPRTFPCDYRAIAQGFKKLANEFHGTGVKVGIPKIGSVLAGGDWERIQKIINSETKGLDITLVEFDGSK